ncbi:MAG TPA: response regulator [Coleofasciculaceae cyanobacterium]|jgi:CheY-like chemotaxis protein
MPKIVAIDDDCLFLELLVGWLEENGFQVIDAHNGQLGLQLIKEQKPDLVICDIKMDEVDGYEVLRQVRQNPLTEKIPFIFMTAYQSNSDFLLSKDLGADDYLPKFGIFMRLINVIKARLGLVNQATVPS